MNTGSPARAVAAWALAIVIAMLAPAAVRADHDAAGPHEHEHAADPTPAKTRKASKQKIAAIEKRGEAVSAAVRKATEPRLVALARQIDLEAESAPDQMAQRLAAETGMTAKAVAGERKSCDTGWGEYVIARTMRANTAFPITTAQIVGLHRDGMSWAMVAHGMGLDVESFVRACETERQVALGETKGDGRMARIAAGAGGNTAAQDDD
jgi:hypothetical protein